MSNQWLPESAIRNRDRFKNILKEFSPSGAVAAITIDHFGSGWHLPIVTSEDTDIPYYQLSTKLPGIGEFEEITESSPLERVLNFCKVPAAFSLKLPLFIYRYALDTNEEVCGVDAPSLVLFSNQKISEQPNDVLLKLCSLWADSWPYIAIFHLNPETYADETETMLIQRACHVLGDAIPAPPFFPFSSFLLKFGRSSFNMGVNAPAFQALTSARASKGEYDEWLKMMWKTFPGETTKDIIADYVAEKSASHFSPLERLILKQFTDIVICPFHVPSKGIRIYCRHNFLSESLPKSEFDYTCKECSNSFELLQNALHIAPLAGALWTTVFAVEDDSDSNNQNIYPVCVCYGTMAFAQRIILSEADYEEYRQFDSKCGHLSLLAAKTEQPLRHNVEHQVNMVLNTFGPMWASRHGDPYNKIRTTFMKCMINIDPLSGMHSSKTEIGIFQAPNPHNVSNWIESLNKASNDERRARIQHVADKYTDLVVCLGLIPIKNVIQNEFAHLCIAKSIADGVLSLALLESLIGHSFPDDHYYMRIKNANGKAKDEPFLGAWTLLFGITQLIERSKLSTESNLKLNIEIKTDGKYTDFDGTLCDGQLQFTISSKNGFGKLDLSKVLHKLPEKNFRDLLDLKHGEFTMALSALSIMALSAEAKRSASDDGITSIVFTYPIEDKSR